jgi:hypothetical protein
LGLAKARRCWSSSHAFEKANGVKIPYKIEPRRPGDVDENYAELRQSPTSELGWKARFNDRRCLSRRLQLPKEESERHSVNLKSVLRERGRFFLFFDFERMVEDLLFFIGFLVKENKTVLLGNLEKNQLAISKLEVR